jgi:peptide chain release factor 1
MKSVIIEIRSAAGGNEAKIWAADLLRMYFKFAQKQNWQAEILNEGIIKISGPDAFEKLKHEAGVHRVQRVPVTEKHGRIHTSTATVAVLPEVEPTQVNINPHDLEWQFFRASTQGGQNVQKVSSAVRLRHKPTGIVVTCQTQRSQVQNRASAMIMLRSKVFQRQQTAQQAKIGQIRQDAVGRGMRAEKVRTYNYPQNRVTDHRIKKKFRLEDIIEGKLDKLTDLILQALPSN